LGVDSTCALWHIYSVTNDSNPLAELKAWFIAQLDELWPVALGSLSLRRSPCIRKNCQACATGEKHASYVLYVRREGKRYGLYIPDELVPQVRAAVANGRKLQALVADAGVRAVGVLKGARSTRRSRS